MKSCRLLILTVATLLTAGCGGGGGGGGGSGGGAASAPASASLAALALAANPISAPARNVLPIAVESAASGWLNFAYASVTICAPGSSDNCQTIDHVLVDTGSTGLRIMSSALSPSLSLPQQVDASGNPIVECAQFASGFIWGPLKLADVKIAGEQASSLAIQVIGDPGFPSIPSNCSGTGATRNTVASFAVNGILGVGAFRQDCGFACAFNANTGIYYVCPPSGCQPAAMPIAEQLQNPVSRFSSDNNGVMVQLPPVAESGAAGVSGALVFGIGTQANNGLGSASVLGLEPTTGQLTTIYKDRAFANSIVDTGANGVFFLDSSIRACTGGAATIGFYCPDSTQYLSAMLQGTNGTSVKVDFSVANADALINDNPAGHTAFSNLGGPLFSFLGFNWGLPFFYGRNVFLAFEGASTPVGAGPYVAF